MLNIVLIHLESISEYFFELHGEQFPFLWELRNKSITYRSAFAAATSTDMFRINLFFSSDRLYDRLCRFPEGIEFRLDACESLLKILQRNGYRVHGLVREDHPCPSSENIYSWGIWNSEIFSRFEVCASEEQLLENVDDILAGAADKPFFLYFHNLYSHIQYAEKLKYGCRTFSERLTAGYRSADSTCRKVVELIERKTGGGQTLFVFVGDHGDDYWTHGYNPLLVHGLLPYSTQIHVPFFFYQAGCSGKTEERLISVTECAGLILNKLGIGSSGFSPGNIVPESEIGKIVFAQNLFLNQPVRHLWNRGFAAVSDRYLLLASNLGLALYDWRADPENHCNLLWFFRLAENGDLQLRPLGSYPVLNAMLSPAIVGQIRLEFPVLLRELKAYLRRKERAVGTELKNPVPDWYFRRILPYLNKAAARELNHPLWMRMEIQFKYYCYMIREQGVGKTLLRAWRRLLRGGKVESRGW